ncbi:nucleotide exchange factor GrpE [Glaciecola sp. SC05]|uniref:nucleotide exchange factor GrpE n=1 Tax=Glaciecola sp. SC05 TaxID=1987355 RepID=UPI0035294F2F
MSQEQDANQPKPEDLEINETLDQASDAEVEAGEQPQVQSLEQAQIQALEEELAVANATISEQKDGVLRARADIENARRRAELEIDKARKFALEKFAGELLPVIDNLERAMQSANSEDEAIKPLLDGVDLTLKSFLSTIEKFGLEIVNPEGEQFNPDHHQAMSLQESTELPANTVMAVMQKGYLLNGRLLRPAMVMVSRAPSEGVDTQA